MVRGDVSSLILCRVGRFSLGHALFQYSPSNLVEHIGCIDNSAEPLRYSAVCLETVDAHILVASNSNIIRLILDQRARSIFIS